MAAIAEQPGLTLRAKPYQYESKDLEPRSLRRWRAPGGRTRLMLAAEVRLRRVTRHYVT